MESKGRSKDPHDRLNEKEKADHSVIVAGPKAHENEKSGASPAGTKTNERKPVGNGTGAEQE